MILPALTPYLALVRVSGAVLVALGLVWAGWHQRALRADRDIAEIHAAQAAGVARAEAAARATEQARIARIEEVTREADTRTAAARRDAAAAADVARRLREHVARLAAGGAAGDSTPAGAGEATSGPGLVLADLFGRADARAGDLAAFADAARSAGIACERSYEALK